MRRSLKTTQEQPRSKKVITIMNNYIPIGCNQKKHTTAKCVLKYDSIPIQQPRMRYVLKMVLSDKCALMKDLRIFGTRINYNKQLF